MNSLLLLASKSPSRAQLLNESQIPFKVIGQDADESQCDWGLDLEKLVSSIALHKMEHALVPDGLQKGEVCFVLTADTLSRDSDGIVNGKPQNRDDAIAKIKRARKGSTLCSAFCLDKRIWNGASWDIDQRIQHSVMARYIFDLPDHWIDYYFEHSRALECAGAIAVEGLGSQFLKFVDGSYSAIIGLPLYELREALENMQFFKRLSQV